MLVTEYLYNQNSLPYKASISPQMNASVCMLCMICMILTGLPVERSYDRSSKCKMKVLHLQIWALDASRLILLVLELLTQFFLVDDELLSVACSSLFLPPEFFYWLSCFSGLMIEIFSLWVQTHYFLQIAPRATLCPRFLIIFSHRDGNTKIITILEELGKSYAYHSSSLLFFRCTTKIFYFSFSFFFAFIFA